VVQVSVDVQGLPIVALVVAQVCPVTVKADESAPLYCKCKIYTIIRHMKKNGRKGKDIEK
jgi:hypothetical protein